MLLFLHGYDEGAPLEITTGVARHGPLRAGNPPHVVQEFIIVAPQLPRRGDLWYRYADSVAAILRVVQQQHSGDPQRSYLTGFSFGGNGVFDLGLLQADLWAALWPVDPTRVPARDPQLPVWISIGEIARYAKREFITAMQLRPASESSRGSRVYADEGDDHVGSATRAYRDARIYAWLLSYSRGA